MQLLLSKSADRRPLRSRFVSHDLARRDLALDAFRGLAIIAMILVNHAPPGVPMVSLFVHSEWHGWTLADIIFPGFLFAAGVAIAWVMPGPGAAPAVLDGVHGRIARRWALLMLLSCVLVNSPHFQWSGFRIAGILAQIAWCSLVVSLLHLRVGWRGLATAALAVTVVHTALLMLLPVPGHGAGVLTPEGNASRWVDHLLLGSHDYNFDFGEKAPYGFLVIFASLSNTLAGALAGHWMRATPDATRRSGGLLVAGFALFALGLLWDHVLPVNKLLWTGSFVALTVGLALQILGTLVWLADGTHTRRWLLPLRVAGVNALFCYVFAQTLQRVLVYGRLHLDDGSTARLRVLIWERAFQPWLPGKAGALLYTLTFLSVCMAVAAWLYHRRWFLKL